MRRVQYSEKYVKALCVGMFVCVVALVCKFNTILLEVYFLLAFVDFPRCVIPSPFAFRQHRQGNSPMDRWEVHRAGERPIHTFTDDCAHPLHLNSLYWHYWQLPRRHGFSSITAWTPHCCYLGPRLTLLPFKPQHNHLQVRYCSLYLVCVAI